MRMRLDFFKSHNANILHVPLANFVNFNPIAHLMKKLCVHTSTESLPFDVQSCEIALKKKEEGVIG